VIAKAIEENDAQRIKSEIERNLEIRREMRAGDLEAMRLEIVDQRLAEAAFPAQRLLGASGGRTGVGIVILVVGNRGERLVAVIIGLAVDIAGIDRAADRRALGEALMQAEFAVVTDRDDAAGAVAASAQPVLVLVKYPP
jgi:hypothetical protein